jgi:hypothetical protein
LDHLKEIIQNFSREEAQEFTTFINRLKYKKGRKDLALFNLLYESKKRPDEYFHKLYPDGNRTAYHALRKKLHKHLVDFIYFKQLNEDYTEETQVAGLISLSRYLMDRKCYQQAMKYLLQAEEVASQNEQFALANTIVNLQLDLPLITLKIDAFEILQRKKQYQRLAREDDNANTAYNLIRYRLELAKRQVDPVDFRSISDEIIQQFQLSDVMVNRPSVLYKFMSILRSIVVAEKAYFSFEPILIKHYNNLEEKQDFAKQDMFYKASLLYMLTHTLFRNKKMEEAIVFLEELDICLKNLNKTQNVQLLPKSSLLWCAVLFFSNRIEEAIQRIDDLWKKELKLESMHQLDVILNESIYRFFNQDFKGANKALLKIGHSDNWCAKVAGVEWVLKRNMIELLIQFELGHIDIASNRLRAIFKKEKLYRKHPRFERAMTYLQLVQEVIDNPGVEIQTTFHDRVENAFHWIPIEEEDLHASVFYAWLKARMLQQTPYAVLLELIKRW